MSPNERRVKFNNCQHLGATTEKLMDNGLNYPDKIIG